MKALSLLEPWATLMVLGEKKNETRSWKTSYRGPLWIHASLGMKRENLLLRDHEPFRSSLRDPNDPFGFVDFSPGMIIGRVEVYNCLPTAFICAEQPEPHEKEFAFGDYNPNRYFFLTRNAMRLETPVPCKGALSIWEIPLETEMALREAKWR